MMSGSVSSSSGEKIYIVIVYVLYIYILLIQFLKYICMDIFFAKFLLLMYYYLLHVFQSKYT